jgi:hypothetical protein
MNAAPDQPFMWSARRRWGVIAVAVLAQFALIHWFSERSPRPLRTADARPALQLAAFAQNEWLTLNTPTLFALPHPLGFSGRAWLKLPEQDYRPGSSTNGPQWLGLTAEALGATFREFLKTNRTGRAAVSIRPVPALSAPSIATTPIRAQARVELSPALQVRGLKSRWSLPVWTNAETLQASEVQVIVDAAGHPVSAVLLNSSGLRSADSHALEMVRTALFGADPARAATADPTDGLVTGQLEFHWITLPADGDGSADPR